GSRDLPEKCGSSSVARSVYLTFRSGYLDRQRRTISPVSCRLAEPAPRMLESMCSSFTTLSMCITLTATRLIFGTLIDNQAPAGHIVLYLVPVEGLCNPWSSSITLRR